MIPMSGFAPSSEQRFCVLTPARAREAVASQRLGGDLESQLTRAEVQAVRELYNADRSGSITFGAVVRRIAAEEGDRFALPTALVLWKAMSAEQRVEVVRQGGQHFNEYLATIAADQDRYSALVGIEVAPSEPPLPEWRVTLAADVSRYGSIVLRAESAEAALAQVTPDHFDQTPMENADELWGRRVTSIAAVGSDGRDDPTTLQDVDRPIGEEVHVGRVGQVDAWKAVVKAAEALLAGFGGDTPDWIRAEAVALENALQAAR